MSPVETTTPPATKAAILQAVLTAKYPREALSSIAGNHGLTLIELQALLRTHGYPDKGAMTHARQMQLQQAYDDETAPVTTSTDPAEADDGDATGVLTQVDITRLYKDPENLRDALREIPELADSIKEVGLLQPIVARRDGQRLVVVAGHRRLAAAQYLRWTHVPCLVRGSMRPDHVIAAMLIENGQRSDLDPIEEARGLNRLKIRLDLSDAQVGAKVGRNQVYVSGRLALLSLTVEEQAEVRAGNMKLIEAQHLGRLNSGKVAKTGQDKNWHFGPTHELGILAKARCHRLGHPRGRTVGGMACGACWEDVIRSAERRHIQDHSARTGTCVSCGSLIEKVAAHA